MWDNLKALNPAKNASLTQGRQVVSYLTAQRLSANPRLYANQVGPGAGMVPEKPNQDNSDLPSWANADSTGNLADLGVPDDEAIYLQVWVPESGGGEGNFCDIADIINYTAQGIMTLKQAVGV